MHGYNDNYFGMHFFWWIFWLIFIVAVAYKFSQKKSKTSNITTLKNLKSRLAKGEITKEEFDRIKKILNN